MGCLEVAGNDRKIMNFPVVHGGRRRRFAGPISTRVAWMWMSRDRLDHLDVAHLLGRHVSPVAGWWCLVWSNLSRLAN